MMLRAIPVPLAPVSDFDERSRLNYVEYLDALATWVRDQYGLAVATAVSTGQERWAGTPCFTCSISDWMGCRPGNRSEGTLKLSLLYGRPAAGSMRSCEPDPRCPAVRFMTYNAELHLAER